MKGAIQIMFYYYYYYYYYYYFPSLIVLFQSLQLVAGSVVLAFEEVCPDRIDLIHKNFRKLCNLLVDVEEWGQVVIINMLTRYARTQFTSPWREVRCQSKIQVISRAQCGDVWFKHIKRLLVGLNVVMCGLNTLNSCFKVTLL